MDPDQLLYERFPYSSAHDYAYDQVPQILDWCTQQLGPEGQNWYLEQAWWGAGFRFCNQDDLTLFEITWY